MLSLSMKPLSVRQRQRGAGWTRWFPPLLCVHGLWVRLLTVLALLCAMPGIPQLAEELATLAVGADCCDDPCDDGDTQSCPGTCGHCMCCAHPSALLPSAQYNVASPMFCELTFTWHGDRPYTSGYRAPAFRPPTA